MAVYRGNVQESNPPFSYLAELAAGVEEGGQMVRYVAQLSLPSGLVAHRIGCERDSVEAVFDGHRGGAIFSSYHATMRGGKPYSWVKRIRTKE